MSNPLMTNMVPLSPRPRLLFKKSAAVSPTVVASTLMIQKYSETSGTLMSTLLRFVGVVEMLLVADIAVSLFDVVSDSQRKDRSVSATVTLVQPWVNGR
jgi:hypothetical protein